MLEVLKDEDHQAEEQRQYAAEQVAEADVEQRLDQTWGARRRPPAQLRAAAYTTDSRLRR
ncbi:MAG: hypothetical protein ACYDCQ_21070 [Dehalococcoidia bacterium]